MQTKSFFSFFLTPSAELVHNIFSLVISLLSMCIVILDISTQTPSYLEPTFFFLGKVFSFFFLSEFIFRLLTTRNKAKYLKFAKTPTSNGKD